MGNARASGGGILSVGGMVTITDANISGNEAIRAGGGIEIVEGTLTITNTSINANDVSVAGGELALAAPGNGGGIHVTGAANVTINGGSVSNNDAGREGGGLWNSATGTLLIRSGTLVNGNSTEAAPDIHDGGGGIFNDGGTLTIDGNDATGPLAAGEVQVNDNKANNTTGNDNASGGGLLTIGGTVTVTNATFQSNEAIRAGGGIEIVDGTLNLTDVNIDGNDVSVAGNPNIPAGTDIEFATPGNGGGLHVTGMNGTLVTITGGTVNGNTAGAEGGGLWNQAGSTLTIDGTTIQGNSTDDAVAADSGGGGIFNNGGTLNVSNATIAMNLADGVSASGGGIFSTDGTVTITNSTISGNEAIRAGGGIEVVEGTLTMTGGSRDGNDVAVQGAITAAPGNGGGLHVTGAALTTIDGVSIVANVAQAEGGGLWNSATGTMVVTDLSGSTVIQGNSALGNGGPGIDNVDIQGGGGIFNNLGTLEIRDENAANTVTITQNVATGADRGSGGGILTNGGTVTITGATISGNEAVRAGGGVEIVNSVVTITNSAITGNDVSSADLTGNGLGANPGNGGGVSTVDVVGSTVSMNAAENEGGGLWSVPAARSPSTGPPSTPTSRTTMAEDSTTRAER